MSDWAIDALVEIGLRELNIGERSCVDIALADALACMSSATLRGSAGRDLSSVENLVTAHAALDLDDVDWSTVHHPGSVVIPSVLATAREVGCTGERLATAVAAGYRISSAIARMLDPGMRSRWHATAVCGAFGAGGAAAIIRRLAPPDVARTLGLIASSVGGLAVAPRARNGAAVFTRIAAASLAVVAARCASRGLPVAPGILSGQGGLSEIFAHAQVRAIDDGRGLTSSSVRLFPVTGFAHAGVWTASTAHGCVDDLVLAQVDVCEATANIQDEDSWWNVARAVGQAIVTGNPFACDAQTALPFEIVVKAKAMPIDHSVVTVHAGDASVKQFSATTPGGLGDPATPELFHRKCAEVLSVSGTQALANAARILDVGVMIGDDVCDWLPDSTTH